MRFAPGAFNRLLSAGGTGLGQALEWRRAYLCPCTDPHSGSPEAGCPVCAGRGSVWASPVAAWAGIASQRVAREWAQYGQWESGDQVMTIAADSPLYAAGENDRLTMTQSSEPFSVPLVRGSGDVLRFPVVQVDRVFWRDPATLALTEGGIPAVADDGSLSWAEDEPPAGVQYSVTGRKRPEFYIFKDFPQDRSHQGGMTLPRRVVARRYDLAGK